MSAPPEEKLALPDLRTVAGAAPRPPSPELAAVVNDALAKLEWYREFLEERGAEPLDFVGQFPANSSPTDAAAAIVTRIGLNDTLRAEATSWESFITLLVRRIEQKGIIVLRSGIVGSNTRRTLSVDEFRGFAVSDTIAPLVFVNSRDAKVAQVFTLAHELAHLWIGASGVSNPNYHERSNEQSNNVERLCNRIAAELLVPSKDFHSRWRVDFTIEENIAALSPRYRVSHFVILRQAYDLGKIDPETYRTHYESYLRLDASRPSTDGGNFYTNLLARNSSVFTRALMSALAEGGITYREAASLLNVRVATLDAVPEYLSQGAA